MAEKDTNQDDTNQFLTFVLGDETYGVEILSVKEIIQYSGVTRVPRTPDHIRGVINLRGSVVPVVDVRMLFGDRHGKDTRRTCIVIVELMHGDRKLESGILVDAVNEVVPLAPEDIEPAPSFGSGTKTQYIRGMGKIDGEENFIILLHLEKLIAPEDIQIIAAAT